MGQRPDTPPQEGVIQYQLDFVTDHYIDCPQFAELNVWRSYLHRLGFIGQDPARYGGLGYGNLSHRAEQDSFVISGTQTGHLPLLCREHYVLVEETDVRRNRIRARGPLPPSSEALTHAALYQAATAIQTVIHVHSPLLWQRAEKLNMKMTPRSVAYGTPAMADAVRRLVVEDDTAEGIIAMQGHEDGIIVYGADVENAGSRLLQAVLDAHQLDEHYFNQH
ncbi:MAG: class II aldolase/adducin family protein [Pseudomonadota bacterium]|nr:class II aldolase/adducin family protein [Pseudomonadota bacterium]